MNNNSTDQELALSERQSLLVRLLDAVKQCQIRFGGRTELATETDSRVVCLCAQFEAVLQHGVRKNSRGLSAFRQVTEMVKGLNLRNVETEPVFWHCIRNHLNKHEYERYMLLKNIYTDTGRGRAWLRSALNESSLERYMHMLLSDSALISQYYEDWAFLMDQERSSMLPAMSAGLGSILFAINIDNPDLNSSRAIRSDSPTMLNLSEPDHSVPQPVIAKSLLTENKKKKKRRPCSQVVSFDDDDLMPKASEKFSNHMYECNSAPATCLSSPVSITGNYPDLSHHCSFPQVSVIAADPSATKGINTVNAFEENNGSSEYASTCSDMLSQSDVSLGEGMHIGPGITTDSACPLQNPRIDVSSDSPAATAHTAIAFHVEGTPSNSPVPLLACQGDSSASESVKNPTGDSAASRTGSTNSSMLLAHDSKRQRRSTSRTSSSCTEDTDTRDCDRYSAVATLTPLEDTSVGELIPVTQADDIPSSEDSISIPSFSEDMENAAAALAIVQKVATWSTSAPSQGVAVVGNPLDKGVLEPRGRSDTLSMSADELREALLVVMHRKEESEEKNSSLRALLDREMEINAGLRAEIEDIKLQEQEKVDKLEMKIQAIIRENELLKHQLKKYIAAVQMLKRDSSEAHETLSDLVGTVQPAVPNPRLYIDHHYEATEYEKKLVQVAEMHGELMEFNDRLHRLLLSKEATIRRLREELVDLRGPFPDDNQTSDDDISVTSDYDAASQTAATRPLINIWIPSAFLTGRPSDVHHVYQIYVRIRDEEWNVYRRYSEFYALHKALKKKNPIMNTFCFPPKKSIGNKDVKFVEARRRRLQHYVRCIVNWVLQKNAELANNPDRETFVSLLPFFGGQSTRSQRTLPTTDISGRQLGSTPSQAPEPVSRHYTGL